MLRPKSPPKEPDNRQNIQKTQKQINNIIKNCLHTTKDARQEIMMYDQSMKEINMKHENFERILGVFDEVEKEEVDKIALIEATFQYKMSKKEEEKEEEITAVKDYHNGALDVNNDNSKYYKKQEQRKLKAQRIQKKKENR